MVHQAIVNFQDEKLVLEPIHVAKHFPDESGNFEVLRIKIGRCVIHVLKSSNRKSEGQNILRHLNKYLAFLLRRENLQQFEALKRAQANVLQAQITPHFLYNTLQNRKLHRRTALDAIVKFGTAQQ